MGTAFFLFLFLVAHRSPDNLCAPSETLLIVACVPTAIFVVSDEYE